MQAATQKSQELNASLTAQFGSRVSVGREGELIRPGEHLRNIRARLGLTTRDVEAYSRRISNEEGNEDYCISSAWLTQVENTASVPGVHKLFSLSVIYRQSFGDQLRLFGVDLTKIENHRLSLHLPNTYPHHLWSRKRESPRLLPCTLRPGVQPEWHQPPFENRWSMGRNSDRAYQQARLQTFHLRIHRLQGFYDVSVPKTGDFCSD